MTYQSRTIARNVVNALALPAWRQAMTETNKLYAIGQRNGVLEAQIVWPHGGSAPPGLWGENEIETVNQHGWTGVVWARDAGPWGKLINQSAGEFSVPNNVQAFDLATGLWEMWQQPLYALDEAGAAALDGDAYYNPTEAAALPATRRFESGSWDGGFPMSYGGWVWRRKALTLSLGNGTTHVNRYNSSIWVPPELTGLGEGARVVNEDTLCGPGGAGRLGATDAGWYDASRLWPSGKNKFFCRWQGSISKARGRLPVPNPEAANGAAITRNASWVDLSQRRLCYFSVGASYFTYYYDLSRGFDNATVSSVRVLTTVGGSPDFGLGRSSRVFTEGHPDGRRLLYVLDETAANTLAMIDDDAGTIHRLQIPGLNVHTGGSADSTQVGMGYRASDNKLILTSRGVGRGCISHVISIPSDPATAASYSCTNTVIPLAAGTSIEVENPYMYGWGQYMPGLDVVITKQYREQLLAYVPA